MAKLLKLRRGTTTQHASFTGAEGELTIDTTKDTAVVHDGSTQSGHTLLREDLSNLPAGQIDNADVNASAAIAGTKISPNFGSQNISTTGNITVGGTVDGVDVANLKTAKDSLSTSNGVIKNGVTATTQAQSDNTTKVATTAYVRSAVAGVVDSSPAALDTLNELAAALGDDANYATTTATTIGTKLPKSGGQMTGNITMSGSQTVDGRDLSVDGAKLDGIESGATADQTASEINALLNGQNITCNGLDAGNGTIRTNGWFYNDDSSDGMYNAATQQHWYSDSGNYWNLGGPNTSYAGIRFRDNHASTIRGYVYSNTSNEIGFLNGQGNWSLKCDGSGNVTATGNVTAYSDARLKTNVNTINDALGIVGKLRGVSFDWIESGKRSIGVIAQEVEAVLPELVVTQNIATEDKAEKEVKSVDYGKIVGVLINAINELKAELDEHKKGGK